MICILATFEMNSKMIYLSPIQGFTDFVYRKVYSTVFKEVDTFFIPYISVKNNQILKKYKSEILPENNLQKKVIPQVLIKDSSEILYLSKLLSDLNYNEINLNLGCPYPMVTKRGKGAGLLPYPEKIKIILSDFFNQQSTRLSVKLRSGLESPEELETVIPVLNEFPLTEVILHARTAKDLYKGKITESAFLAASKYLKHKLDSITAVELGAETALLAVLGAALLVLALLAHVVATLRAVVVVRAGHRDPRHAHAYGQQDHPQVRPHVLLLVPGIGPLLS